MGVLRWCEVVGVALDVVQLGMLWWMGVLWLCLVVALLLDVLWLCCVVALLLDVMLQGVLRQLGVLLLGVLWLCRVVEVLCLGVLQL